MKCWFLDETQEPEEKPLRAEQRREPYNKLIPHNRELFSMQLQPSKTRILHLQYSFWYISSPVMRRIRRGISLLSKKSTQVDDFLFLLLNWLEDGQSFLRHETVNGGDRKREFLSVAKQTPYFHFNHNYNKILKSDWLSTVLISAQ